MIKILEPLPTNRPKVKAALFDFDGTISTLRHGWEKVMEPLCLEMIAGDSPVTPELVKEVQEYIEFSTGIQTIHQMIWLAERVKSYGKNPNAPEDPWWYKAEYNRRLMEAIKNRIENVTTGSSPKKSYLVDNSEEFLEGLKERGIAMYVASGTDHPDVMNESGVLGLHNYFSEIAGAPVGKIDCSKEAVLRKLVQDYKLNGMEVVVIGDGKVEIALGREMGGISLGIASDEENLKGFNTDKERRLTNAGANALVGDFSNAQEIFDWLGV